MPTWLELADAEAEAFNTQPKPKTNALSYRPKTREGSEVVNNLNAKVQDIMAPYGDDDAA